MKVETDAVLVVFWRWAEMVLRWIVFIVFLLRTNLLLVFVYFVLIWSVCVFMLVSHVFCVFLCLSLTCLHATHRYSPVMWTQCPVPHLSRSHPPCPTLSPSTPRPHHQPRSCYLAPHHSLPPDHQSHGRLWTWHLKYSAVVRRFPRSRLGWCRGLD